MSKSSCLSLALALLLGGCGAHRAQRTGFLSDYSSIERDARKRYAYQVPNQTLGQYHCFIVDPVEIRPYRDAKLNENKARQLAAFMHETVLDELADDYEVVTQPGPQVARLRIAITDIRAAKWYLNVHPGMKLTRAGAGEAAIEAELVDSVTGQQLLALVESQKGNPVELDTFSKYDDARDVMRAWAKRLRKRLDAAQREM
jgi:hypothetical protein